MSAKQADFSVLIHKIESQLEKALARLEKSYAKTLKLPTDLEALSDEQQESWEGHASRFARAVDLFISKYIRTQVTRQEPGFRGSTRDFLQQAEKMALISSAERWAALKELRNRQAHDYEDEDLAGLYEAIRTETPLVLEIKSHLTQP